MDLEWLAILLIVLVFAIAILSWMWEELDREQRYHWSEKMRALGDAAKQAGTRRIK
ncbi:unnamed protein product [marine sediment metagenome]|uniref:Uncharacterized protein n=1 Tax=marine sediment metagenome TaxID=412755 RepID=X0SJY9_9ZZZZ